MPVELLFPCLASESWHPYGTVISIQARSTHDLFPLYFKTAGLYIVFILLPLLYNIQRERHGEILRQMAELVDKGLLTLYLDSHPFSFEDVGKAHALLESGKAIAKIVI